MRYDSDRGAREVLVVALGGNSSRQGDSVPSVDKVGSWSPDNRLLLIFTNSQPAAGG